MKNILIIGKNSYLANCFAKRLDKCGNYKFDMISAKDDAWRKTDYSKYDSVVIFSGIVHRKENKSDEKLYYAVNSQLSCDICKTAKQSGAKQLVFLSTMSVFGKLDGIITDKTPLLPNTLYGKSKLSGERAVLEQSDKNFNVAVVRPPMVYGKNCTGNYARLSSLVKKAPFFPQIENKRSMIYEENLSEFLRLLCESGAGGIYHPQNHEYVQTSEMARLICKNVDKKFKATRLFNIFVRLLSRFVPTFKKLFGTLCYEKTMSQTNFGNYNIVGFEESIIFSEQE